MEYCQGTHRRTAAEWAIYNAAQREKEQAVEVRFGEFDEPEPAPELPPKPEEPGDWKWNKTYQEWQRESEYLYF